MALLDDELLETFFDRMHQDDKIPEGIAVNLRDLLARPTVPAAAQVTKLIRDRSTAVAV